MWSRKRLDIGWTDLAAGLARCFGFSDREALSQRLERDWSASRARQPGCSAAAGPLVDERNTLVCLSVRTGFDLLLGALDLPRGSEVLMSALTIPDMPRIVEHHGLVPVPVDLDIETLSVDPGALRRAVTPKARALVVAHLFGSRMPLEPVAAVAREHGLLLIEDCAQAYVGPEYCGHPEADVSLFSFGPIKTATALAGAILHVREQPVARRSPNRRTDVDRRSAEPGSLGRPSVADVSRTGDRDTTGNRWLPKTMRAAHGRYPVQSRGAFLLRVLKYAALKSVSPRLVYRLLVVGLRLAGRDHDQVLNSLVRGFGVSGSPASSRAGPCGPGPARHGPALHWQGARHGTAVNGETARHRAAANGDLFARLRQRPSVPLLALLRRRISNFDHNRLRQRTERGCRLVERLAEAVTIPGRRADPHSFWVFPIVVDDPERTIAALRKAGFDATQGQSMCVIAPPPERPELEPRAAGNMLSRIVFLPLYPEMPVSEVDRMAEVISSLPIATGAVGRVDAEMRPAPKSV